MNDVIIVVDKNAMAYKKCLFQKLGNEQQNLQNKLKFEFEDNILEGQAWLEYEIDGVKKFAPMEKYELGYQIDIKNCLLTGNQVSVDLKITQDENPNGVPVFVTNIITFDVEKTICAEEEEPEQYPNWFETANKIINEANNLNLDINKNDKVSTITINKKDGTQKSVDVYDGTDGKNGEDATINGHNTLIITTDNNVTLAQQENIMKLGLNSQLIPKNKVEGTENIFEDGLDMSLFEFSGDGKSEQVTTTGKNIFDYIYFYNNYVEPTTGDIGRLLYTLKPNTNYTISTNKHAISGTKFSCFFAWKGSEIQKENISTDYQGVLPNSPRTITTDENGNLILGIYTSGDNKVEKSEFENGKALIQIEEGLIASEYEPYTGLESSPNPNYPQEIKSISDVKLKINSKNLFDIEKYIDDNSDYYHLENENLICDSVDSRTQGFVYTFFEKGTYTVSMTNICNATVFEEDSQYFLIQKQNVNEFTFNLEENKNLHFKFFKNEVPYNIGKIQIEKGSIATEYNPYVEPNEVILDLGEEKLSSIEDIKDKLIVDLETGDYYKKENIVELILDGSQEYIGWHSTGNNFSIDISKKGVRNNIICTHYKAGNSGEIGKIDISYDGQSIYIHQPQEDINTVELIRNWLSKNTPIVNYQLATPTTKKLGKLSSEDLSKLKTFNGYNNITVNTNLGLMNVRLTYGLDIKKYVDNKLKIATQI